jgi:hypothetical protein
MRKLIIQVQIDPKHNKHIISRKFHHINDLYELSANQAKKYAKFCDSDYIQITDCSFLPDKHPCFQRLKLFHISNYDSILYLDSDAVLMDNVPNIFELYGQYDFCATWDINWDSQSKYYKNVLSQVQKKYNSSNTYMPFCSGVMLLHRNFIDRAKTIYPKYLEEFNNRGYYDQGVLNKTVVEMGEQYTRLPEDWGAWYKTGKYIVHLATSKKKNFDLGKFIQKHQIQYQTNIHQTIVS